MKRTTATTAALAAAILGAWAGSGPGPAVAQLYDPCPYTNDGDCDEPNGLNLCAWGTDTADCANPNSNFGSGPGFGATTGPAPGATAGLYDPCPYTNDGDCDEPNGLNLCAWGTDTADCANPDSYYGSGPGYGAGPRATAPGHTQPGASPSTYAPWTRITNDQRQYAAQPGGVFPLMISNGMHFEAGAYVIYHGLTDGSGPYAPITNVQAVAVTLAPDTRYIARASSWGIESFQPGGGSLIM